MIFMESKLLIARALKKEFLTADEGRYLFDNISTSEFAIIIIPVPLGPSPTIFPSGAKLSVSLSRI